MGLYSTRHHSLAAVKPGATVAVPNDPVNLERALKILQAIGWIRIRENPNPVDVSERDVVANQVGEPQLAGDRRHCRGLSLERIPRRDPAQRHL